jgi:hypothetical protein
MHSQLVGGPRSNIPVQGPARQPLGCLGVSSPRPGVSHPWGANGCREASPLTH